MTEQELRELLSRPVEVPREVEARMAETCARAGQTSGKRRPRRGLRTLVLAACLAAALCVGAAAGYGANHSTVFQLFFGNENRTSVEAQQEYDEYGRLTLNLPDTERVPVDEEEAESLVGSYLSEEPFVWQVGEYTLTVEQYLLDEHTGTAKIYYSLYRPGGIEGLAVSPYDGTVWADGTGIGMPHFCVRTDGEWSVLRGDVYLDQSRSTEDTWYLAASLADFRAWRAADGLRIEFHDLRLEDESGQGLYVGLVDTTELPGAESLPAVTAVNPETGGTAVCLSAIGMLADTSYLEDGDYVRSVSLEYADGSTYVVRDDAGSVDNTEYGLYNMDGTQLRLCFNRLVDPEQVVSVTVDGTVYAVNW